MAGHDWLIGAPLRKGKAMGKRWIMLLMTLHARIYHGSLGGQSHRVGSPLRHGTLQLVAVFHDYVRC